MAKFEVGDIYKCKDADSGEIFSIEEVVSLRPLKTKTLYILHKGCDYDVGIIMQTEPYSLIPLNNTERILYG